VTIQPVDIVADPHDGHGGFFPAGVQAVVFDVVGTLVDPSPPVAEAYRLAAAGHGVDRGAEQIAARFREAWREQERIDAAAPIPFATSGVREQDRWRRIVADVFEEHPASDFIFRDLWDHFGRPEAWRAIPLGSRLVQRAIDAGLTVALASNFDERLFPIAEAIEPLSWADHVFASSEIGWRKPAPEFFRVLEERLGCRPEETLLVGDDPELDIRAARRAGWRTLGVGAASG
jgi:putative hydrolase of the HAD superfamily